MIPRLAAVAAQLHWAFCLIALSGPAVARPVDDKLSSTPPSCKAETVDAKGFKELAACEARLIGLPPQIATAVMEIESGFDPGAKGAAGEVGLMQVMPTTAQMLGFHGGKELLANPAVNIALGVRYLAKAHRLASGDLCTTVMKYRAGHAETRFSGRSVAYCLQARKILGRDGYEVTGKVPTVTLARVGKTSPTARREASAPPVACVTGNAGRGPWVRECTDSSVRITKVKLAFGTRTDSRSRKVRVTRGGVTTSYSVNRAK